MLIGKSGIGNGKESKKYGGQCPPRLTLASQIVMGIAHHTDLQKSFRLIGENE
jgi:hypothetical protein